MQDKDRPKIAHIAEYSSVPYVENLAKTAIIFMKLLETKDKDREEITELCESIANTIVVMDTVTRMEGGMGEAYFKDISMEMEQYLEVIIRDISPEIPGYPPQTAPDQTNTPTDITGALKANELRDDIQAYRKRIDDLKVDFLIHLTGDCMSSLGEITRMQSIIYKDRASYSSDFKYSPFLGAFSTESLPVSLFVLFFFLLSFSFLVPEGMGILHL
ncbi:hypothetical protein EDD85DRAFT_942352 [Armillaria nabsnona]|nr:hypothetical protein EDD85DRAFT_942352 [Armillaria nabsnona]